MRKVILIAKMIAAGPVQDLLMFLQEYASNGD